MTVILNIIANVINFMVSTWILFQRSSAKIQLSRYIKIFYIKQVALCTWVYTWGLLSMEYLMSWVTMGQELPISTPTIILFVVTGINYLFFGNFADLYGEKLIKDESKNIFFINKNFQPRKRKGLTAGSLMI